MSTYEQILHDVQQLTPEEQRRLRNELEQPEQRKQKTPTQEAARAAEEHRAQAQEFLNQVDRLATQITAKWQGTPSAVDAVREGRRDL